MPPSTPTPAPPIILFTYPESVYGNRILNYLNLRKIPHTPIRVPPHLPRPLLHQTLKIHYRRIPLLSLGRDIYIDTRLILHKLETLFPTGRLGSPDPFSAGIERLVEEFVIDGGPFARTAACIPPEMPWMQDPVWVRDRAEGSGGAFTKDGLRDNRAWSISQVRVYFGMLEGMLADGREWVVVGDGAGDGAGPGLADVHAAWVFGWGLAMGEVVGGEDLKRAVGGGRFPRVEAWVERFRRATAEAARGNVGADVLREGREAEDEVVERILKAGFVEPRELVFDEGDVLGLKRGQRVSVSPVDFGFTHKDEGVVVGLSENEVVLEIDAPRGNGKLRLHYPRINFKIVPTDVSTEKL